MSRKRPSRRQALREFSAQADLFGDGSGNQPARPAAPATSDHVRTIHWLARRWILDRNYSGAIGVMLQFLTEDERKRIMGILVNMSYGPPRRMTAEESAAADAARKSGRTWKEELALRREQRERAAVEELQALLASGGRTH
ncbi:MAG TPA: hypothetical protein VH913_14175 [Hyphomicrobiaceae bacterium]|jgi:hypothetical protein